MKYCIYGLKDPRTAEIRYVGKSSSVMQRPLSHATLGSLAKPSHKNNWIKQLKSLGLSYAVVVLEEPGKAKLDERERFWIAEGRRLGWSLTNIASGGEGNDSESWTSEMRKKVSIAQTGRKHTSEHIAKRVAGIRAKRGTKTLEQLDHYRQATLSRLTPEMVEHVRKVGKSNRGKKQAPEVVEWRAAKLRGLKWSEKRRALGGVSFKGHSHIKESLERMSISHGGRPFVEVTTGRRFISQNEAAHLFGCSAWCVARSLKKGVPSSKGLIFQYEVLV